MPTRRMNPVIPIASVLLLITIGACEAQDAFSRNETWEESRDRLTKALLHVGTHETTDRVLTGLKAAGTRREFHQALEPMIALDVSINPESRVKVSSRRPRVKLQLGRPHRFLIQVENTAGITAPLNLAAIDVATHPPKAATWCSIEVVVCPSTSRYLSGANSEFKMMQITPHVAGLREIRIVGDAGQGTQDLGFRATTDVLLDVEPTVSDVNVR